MKWWIFVCQLKKFSVGYRKQLLLCQYSFDGCRSPRFILEKAQTKVWIPTGTRQNKVDRVLQGLYLKDLEN